MHKISWWQRPMVQFIARTVLYSVIIIGLVYLYSYRGVGQSHFIYNEF
ncbi:teichoic acid D-Ala incorporation-associated protein DltX [Lacticaseibacillus baoqingensis]|uniref:Teichoic acid D-Ala incorporation-associated protein DltX n=1 Tax=Lacticaseibacillus baoqingensis TaxID=2486013 RepID=A0ABW4E6H2_9LACO|nr:teichoic acid D-Ala incorporation-associated protein DltX [Lacticaseibacillus baoqingensis]